MDNLGKCHGKINTMIELKANGSSSNWLPPIHCRTCDAHMSISNKLHHKETKTNTVKCWKTPLVSASSMPRQCELFQLPDKHERKELGLFLAFFFPLLFCRRATSIYLKHTNLSVTVEEGEIYKTHTVVLYRSKRLKSSNSPQPISSVHYMLLQLSLVQF